ncbi:glycosyltransferase [Oscillatoria sp. FACHB-1407]|uniref:glycosyltransferase n=1 Tax=Oscillatoria sp. FACHB-1407 TaxID=2692847 RepID=UPI001688DA4F|nr:glycosyltransferase [Oscillatoria sp. FACHB-1407]MBD2465107.1 glycosyltransferase [Oscillatoria sp. FACHB-1407]
MTAPSSARYFCPCCGNSCAQWLDFSSTYRNVTCPHCASQPRHRALKLYLLERTNLYKDPLKVLHFAPESFLRNAIASLPNLDYVTTDLMDPSVDINFDITNIPFDDDSFDVIFCSHVLEHVPDDRAAMQELFRILKPGGWAFLQVPIDIYREQSFDDPTITDPEERRKFYWQEDHVRLYGLDYKERLEQAGFTVKVEDYAKQLDPVLVERYGLDLSENLYFGVKPLVVTPQFAIEVITDDLSEAITEIDVDDENTEIVAVNNTVHSAQQPPRISVVIPCFNYGRFIQQAVESVLSQSYTDYELIVVDDGSTDDTRTVLQPYGDRLRYFYQVNQGPAATRNQGLELARGEFIIFLDADDFFLPNILADQIACFAEKPSLGAVVSGWRLVNESGEFISDLELWKSLPALTAEAWIVWRPVLPSATLFRREWLEKIGGFRGDFPPAEDAECFLNLALSGCKTDWCRQIGVCYRQHGKAMTRNTVRQANQFQALYNQFFAKADLPPSFQQLESKTRYHLLVWLAWRFYHAQSFTEMAFYLKESLSYTPFSPIETISNWVESFSECCIGHGYLLDTYALSQEVNWQQLIQSVLKTQKPKVSVIIPAYNAAKYVSQAIASVLNQTFDSYEVIVIDDGSTDDTQAVIESYRDRPLGEAVSHRIRYYYQQNRGVSATRNRGIQLAQGELIAFLDADDYFLPDKLAKQVEVFAANPDVGMVNSGFRTVRENGEAIADIQWWRSMPQLTPEDWLLYKPVLPSALMFRRDWLMQVGGFDPQLAAAEDVDLVLRLVVAGCQSAWLTEITACYRQHDYSACSQNTPNIARSAEQVLLKFFAQPDLPTPWRSLQASCCYQTLVWAAWRLYCTDYTQEMGDYLKKSLRYSPYPPAATVENWIESFTAYSRSFGTPFNAYDFSRLPEWQDAIATAIQPAPSSGILKVSEISKIRESV